MSRSFGCSRNPPPLREGKLLRTRRPQPMNVFLSQRPAKVSTKPDNLQDSLGAASANFSKRFDACRTVVKDCRWRTCVQIRQRKIFSRVDGFVIEWPRNVLKPPRLSEGKYADSFCL